MDVALFRSQFLLEESRQVHLAHEADALRVLALGGGESLLGGDAPHFGFQQIADREQGVAQLLLRKLAEKIALVLVGVGAGEQLEDRPSVGKNFFDLAAVVARGDEVRAQLEGFAQKDVEFDFAVAQHVGVGCAALFVLGEHVIDHARTVVGREVYDAQRNVEPFGDQLGENPVVVPRAVAFERARGVVPVDHEKPRDVVPLPFEEIRRDGRIHAAR